MNVKLIQTKEGVIAEALKKLSSPQTKGEDKKKYTLEIREALAVSLIEEFSCIALDDSKEVFMFRDGVYVPGTRFLRQEIEKRLGKYATINIKVELIDRIRDRTSRPRSDVGSDIRMINIDNGILNIKTRELIPHSSKHIFFTKLPVTYDSSADCPKIKSFLKETLVDEDSIKTVQEEFGFGLRREYFLKKAMIFLGPPDTGKTTLLNVFHVFYGGDANVSNVGLREMGNDRFALIGCWNKMMNIADELPRKNIEDNGKFKMLTGRSSIYAQYKHEQGFTFTNYAKLLFACNNIPPIKDSDDEAFYSRIIVINFEQQIAPEDQIECLDHKFTTKEELSGLLNFALEGLERLEAHGRFSLVTSPEAIKKVLEVSSSAVADFAQTIITPVREDPHAVISKQDMYSKYLAFIQVRKGSVLTPLAFTPQLKKYATYLLERKGRDGTDRPRLWTNVKFTDEGEALHHEQSIPIKVEPLFD